MNTTTRTLAAAAAFAVTAALLAGPAYAQDGVALSREVVKEQLRAAQQAGEIVSGEGSPQGPQFVATKTRADRKAETMEARRKGEFQAGGMGLYKQHMSQQTATAKSTKTRVERKGETMRAIQEHKTMQPGEAA